jgi:hypothetical protein
MVRDVCCVITMALDETAEVLKTVDVLKVLSLNIDAISLFFCLLSLIVLHCFVSKRAFV